MGLPQSAVKQLDTMPPIEPSNYQKGKKTLKNFFNGVHATWIRDATASASDNSAVPSGKEDDDAEIQWILYTKLHPDYQYLVDDLKSGLAAWKAILARFETSTLTTRVEARFDHDTSKPMDVYVSGIIGHGHGSRLCGAALNFGVSAFGNLAKAEVDLALDTSASLKVSVEVSVKAATTINKFSSTSAITAKETTKSSAASASSTVTSAKSVGTASSSKTMHDTTSTSTKAMHRSTPIQGQTNFSWCEY
ncbi:hypothetical protein B0H14DRAFT_3491773 [Mycena olivaceomarginata]|nr:hypothetical protein B0H14DRAFT_3491773 [Mycena olivaceomarginata]